MCGLEWAWRGEEGLGKDSFRKLKVANKCLFASTDGQTDGQAQSNKPPSTSSKSGA